MLKILSQNVPTQNMTYNAIIQNYPKLQQLVQLYQSQNNSTNKQNMGAPVWGDPQGGEFQSNQTKQAIINYLKYIGIDGTRVPELAEIIL